MALKNVARPVFRASHDRSYLYKVKPHGTGYNILSIYTDGNDCISISYTEYPILSQAEFDIVHKKVPIAAKEFKTALKKATDHIKTF